MIKHKQAYNSTYSFGTICRSESWDDADSIVLTRVKHWKHVTCKKCIKKRKK